MKAKKNQNMLNTVTLGTVAYSCYKEMHNLVSPADDLWCLFYALLWSW